MSWDDDRALRDEAKNLAAQFDSVVAALESAEDAESRESFVAHFSAFLHRLKEARSGAVDLLDKFELHSVERS